MNVSIWQLADESETYGDKAGKFILTSPDGETELSQTVFDTVQDATDFANGLGWRIVSMES